MRWVFNDGGLGRPTGGAARGDCVARAIAIAMHRPYEEVYEEINEYAQARKAYGDTSSAKDGVSREVYRAYLEDHGWTWHATGSKRHLREGELPMGRLVVKVQQHLVAVIDGVIHDTYDPSHGGHRLVLGYFTLEEEIDDGEE